ncbi:MAG: hypothetical protein AAF902_13265 [Chloroflexota bacterium]
MIKLQEMTYVTVITVEIPDPNGDGQKTIQAAVKLLPHDMVEIVQGDADAGHVKLKPVRECSLAELMQFAEDLEGNIPEVFEQIQLTDIADADNATITFAPINDREEEMPSAEDLFDGASIVFPSELLKSAPDDSPVAAEDSDAPTDLSDLETLVEDNISLDDSLEPVEEIPLNESESADVRNESIVDIVIHSEPAAPETEEDDDAEFVPFEPDVTEDNRLAGRKLDVDTPYPAACDILFMEQAFEDAKAHSLTSLRREVAGFMIGPPPEKQPDGRYLVHVTQMIPAQHTVMQGASVTYTPESWRTIHDWLLENYPKEDQIIVGWYHTHPGFGIFLSNMDLFIHRNFFPQKWHVALVLDPVNYKSGYFCWNKAQTQIMPYDMPWPYWAHSSW